MPPQELRVGAEVPKNTVDVLYSGRGIVKDGSGSYAAFTEQGASVSQMSAATVIDVIARLAGCA